MGQHSDRAREALLDAAEELFAVHGIDAVSNRRIAEHAGSANHSAIGYHFGTRDDLIRALITRYIDGIGDRAQQLIAELGDDPTVYDIVRARLLPQFEHLDALPRPSWRARFLAQVRSVPSAVAVLEESLVETDGSLDFALLKTHVEGVSDAVLRGRSSIIGHLVLGVCGEYEEQMNRGDVSADWISVGYFLIDASAGMLSAPVTHPDAVLNAPARSGLI